MSFVIAIIIANIAFIFTVIIETTASGIVIVVFRNMNCGVVV